MQLGGKIASGVTKSLSHLIVGDAPGNKLQKAEKLNIPIHEETWLVERLREIWSDAGRPQAAPRLSLRPT